MKQNIDISSSNSADAVCIICKIKPTEKDLRMVKDNLSWNGNSFYGSGAPFSTQARKLAKSMKTQKNLIRKAKAVIQIWGTKDYQGGIGGGEWVTENAWKPFLDKLKEMNFSQKQINEIIYN